MKLPPTTITSVIDRFQKRGSVENIPRKGKQAKLDNRDTRKLLRSVKENRKSLSDVTALLNQYRESVISRKNCSENFVKAGIF